MSNHTQLSTEERNDAFSLLELSMGYVVQAALRSVAKLGVSDHLIDGPKTAAQLGQELGIDSKQLQRVMRILVPHAVYYENPDGLFSLAIAGHFLCSRHSHSLRSAVLMLTDKTFWQPSIQLADIIKGEPVFTNLFGMPFYDYWSKNEKNPHDDDFHDGMSSMSRVENEVLVNAYTFPENATVIDIAGGMGDLLLTVLRKNKTLKGILFDQEKVLVRNSLSKLADASRWETISGSFFNECPSADIYLLKYIIMDWSDKQAIKILQTCRKSMKTTSRLLILEPIIKSGENEQGRYELDLLLLAGFDGGRARSEKELSDMLGEARLRISRVIHTPTYLSIIEASPC